MPFYTPGKRGTIKGPKKFDADAACRQLQEGMQGYGTNEATITEVLTSHTNQQRQDMKLKFQAMYRKDLVKELKSELNFSFEQVVVALLKDPQEYILEDIHEAVTITFFEGVMFKLRKAASKKGLGLDEYTLIGLLCLRTRNELIEIKKAYKEKYKKYLDKKIAAAENLPLDFRRLLLGMIDCKRDEGSQMDNDQLFKDVMNLIGSKKEDYFHGIMHDRSYRHIRQLCEGYQGLKGKPIETFVEESSYSDAMKETYIAVLTLIQNEPLFYAQRLHAAFDGAGTDDDALIRIVVLRSEIDLVDIIRLYEKIYQTSLIKDAAGETSGDYEDIILKLLTIPEEFRHEVEEEQEPEATEAEPQISEE